MKVKRIHPKARVIVHPECRPEVTALADVVTSTEGMSKYIQKAPDTEFIIGTETGIIHRMKKENPDKIFYPATEMAVCPNMKKITLEKVLWSLEDLSYEIIVPPDIMEKARLSIERMLQMV